MSGTFRQRPGWPGTGRPTSVAGTRTGLPGRGPQAALPSVKEGRPHAAPQHCPGVDAGQGRGGGGWLWLAPGPGKAYQGVGPDTPVSENSQTRC